MATSSQLPLPRAVFYDANGNPLAAGFVHTYVPGTTTPKTTWQDTTESVANSNPIVLDANGSCLLFGAGTYDLAVTDAYGNSIPAYSGTTYDLLSLFSQSITTLATIAALRAYSTTPPASVVYVEGFSANGDGGEGNFVYVSTDVTTADNGGTIIVDSLSRRWYREPTGPVTVLHFGADPTGVADSTTVIQAALNASLAVSFPEKPTGGAATYKVTGPLTPQIGQQIIGDGPQAAIISQATASNAIFAKTAVALTEGGISISGVTLQGAAAGVVGAEFTLLSNIRLENILFSGCAGNAVLIDRGYQHRLIECLSRPNASFQAGNFKCWSSDDANYCFYPELRDCRVDCRDEMGTTLGAVSPCVYFRRVVGGLISNFVGERLNQPTADAVVGIQIENDCQGCLIEGGVTYGASTGVYALPAGGAAVAPGYLKIIGHDIDFFTTDGILVAGTGAAASADVMIADCVITAPQGSALCINVAHTLRLSVQGNIIDQYGTKGGSGIQIADVNTGLIQNNTFNNLTTAIGFSGTSNVNTSVMGNVVTNCTNTVIGDITAGGVGTNLVTGNNGVEPSGILITTPSVPASGGTVVNTTGVHVTVVVAGGTTVNVTVNGVGTSLAAGVFLVAANGSIGLTYAAAPTWVWVPTL